MLSSPLACLIIKASPLKVINGIPFLETKKQTWKVNIYIMVKETHPEGMAH
jgi:hypothetical protein